MSNVHVVVRTAWDRKAQVLECLVRLEGVLRELVTAPVSFTFDFSDEVERMVARMVAVTDKFETPGGDIAEELEVALDADEIPNVNLDEIRKEFEGLACVQFPSDMADLRRLASRLAFCCRRIRADFELPRPQSARAKHRAFCRMVLTNSRLRLFCRFAEGLQPDDAAGEAWKRRFLECVDQLYAPLAATLVQASTVPRLAPDVH